MRVISDANLINDFVTCTTRIVGLTIGLCQIGGVRSGELGAKKNVAKTEVKTF